MSAHPTGARAPDDEPVIALVASGGGLDAVSRIFSALPESFDACLIVLIHQQPDRVSQLVPLLQRQSVLPVVEAEDGALMQPGRVIVVPPGSHLLITPGPRTILIRSGAAPPSRPSADLLLATLATAAAGRAIAVILSGGGHDGATGATAVHVCGGTVVATDEASSELFAMPRAAIQRDDVVDHVVQLDDVAQLLGTLVSR